jgi:hypothetical protein
MSADAGLEVKVLLAGLETPASDASHRPDTRFDVAIGGIADGHYYTLFNLTGNGQVEMLEPYPGARPEFNHPRFGTGARKDKRSVTIGGVWVKPQGPFGAEHIVAVAGALPLSRLMPVLAKAHNRLAVPDVMAALASEAEVQPLQVGFRGIYTART